MKILNSKTKNFDKNLDYLLFKRRKSIKSDKVSVTNIINDVKKNGDKALIKYEKKFNQNSTIIPSALKISKLIKSLNPKVKKAIDTAYNRIYKFHSLQKFKNISYTDKFKNKLQSTQTNIERIFLREEEKTFSNPNINIYIGSYDNEENINRKSNIHRARLSKFKKSKLNGEMIFQDDEQRIYKFNNGKKVYL